MTDKKDNPAPHTHVVGDVYGPYTVTFMGPAVWAGIKDELPPELVDKQVWLTTTPPMKKREPMTDEEIAHACRITGSLNLVKTIVRAVEEHHGIHSLVTDEAPEHG